MAAERWDRMDFHMRTTVSQRRHARTVTLNSLSLRSAFIALLVSSVLLGIAHIREYAMLTPLARQQQQMNRELRLLRQEHSNLDADVKILERPARIDALAPKLGMRQRVQADYVTLAAKPREPILEANRPAIAGFISRFWEHKDQQDR